MRLELSHRNHCPDHSPTSFKGLTTKRLTVGGQGEGGGGGSWLTMKWPVTERYRCGSWYRSRFFCIDQTWCRFHDCHIVTFGVPSFPTFPPSIPPLSACQSVCLSFYASPSFLLSFSHSLYSNSSSTPLPTHSPGFFLLSLSISHSISLSLSFSLPLPLSLSLSLAPLFSLPLPSFIGLFSSFSSPFPIISSFPIVFPLFT